MTLTNVQSHRSMSKYIKTKHFADFRRFDPQTSSLQTVKGTKIYLNALDLDIKSRSKVKIKGHRC